MYDDQESREERQEHTETQTPGYQEPVRQESGAYRGAAMDPRWEAARQPVYSNSPQWQPPHWQQNPTPAPKRKKEHRAGRVVALCLCCALIGGIMGFGGSLLGSKVGKKGTDSDAASDSTTLYQAERPVTDVDLTSVKPGDQLTAAQVYAQNVNSTVGITTSITTNYWGYQTTSAASGSGFFISADGYVITNYHVIEDSNSVTVATYDGNTYDAAVIGYDEENDVAVLKVDADTEFTPVVLGSSDALHVGDDVVAIGNPLGELTFSLTSGAVSALDRKTTMSSGNSMDLIQTDCAINSGNSGGALFNLYGEVVGITNAKYSSSSSGASIDNICFAIPISNVINIVTSIMENGFVVKPYIGITVGTVSEETQSYGLPKGASVQSVTEDGPAAKAGLQQNDIITKANDTDITSSDELVDYIADCTPGDTLTLTVYRQGETVTITITVGEKTQSALAEDSGSQSQQQQQQQQQSQGGYGYSFPFDYFFGYGN